MTSNMGNERSSNVSNNGLGEPRLGRFGGRGGYLGLKSHEIFFCGQQRGWSCKCQHCSTNKCGPEEGCPCESCEHLTLRRQRKKLSFFMSKAPYHLTCATHQHPLKFVHQNDDWVCAGLNMRGGCSQGSKGYGQSQGRMRFQCEACRFDLCEVCVVTSSCDWKISNSDGLFARLGGSATGFMTSEKTSLGVPCHMIFYCSRFPNYACRCGGKCNGRKCGPNKGCPCGPCFNLSRELAVALVAENDGSPDWFVRAAQEPQEQATTTASTACSIAMAAPAPISTTASSSATTLTSFPMGSVNWLFSSSSVTEVATNHATTSSRQYYVCNHAHPLIEAARGHRGDWICHGSYLSRGCLQGCTAENYSQLQTSSWRLFICGHPHCEGTGFNYCVSCMEEYREIGTRVYGSSVSIDHRGSYAATNSSSIVVPSPTPSPLPLASTGATVTAETIRSSFLIEFPTQEVMSPLLNNATSASSAPESFPLAPIHLTNDRVAHSVTSSSSSAGMIQETQLVPIRYTHGIRHRSEIDTVPAIHDYETRLTEAIEDRSRIATQLQELQDQLDRLKAVPSFLREIKSVAVCQQLQEELQRSLQRVEARKLELLRLDQESRFCVICQERDRSIVLIPCRHLCLCAMCSERADLSRCPICRANIQSKMEIFNI